MSATHRRSGASGAKLRFTRSGAGGVRSVCERRVVQSLPSTPTAPEQPGLSHQPRHSFPGASHAQRPQLKVDPRSTVGLSAVSVNTNNLLRKQGVCPRSSRGRSVSPTVEAALRDLQRPAHRAHLVVRLLCFDEGVDHLRVRRSSSLAKNVAAFFRISRSSLRTFTSLRSVSVETSRSRAIFATGYLSSEE